MPTMSLANNKTSIPASAMQEHHLETMLAMFQDIGQFSVRWLIHN